MTNEEWTRRLADLAYDFKKLDTNAAIEAIIDHARQAPREAKGPPFTTRAEAYDYLRSGGKLECGEHEYRWDDVDGILSRRKGETRWCLESISVWHTFKLPWTPRRWGDGDIEWVEVKSKSEASRECCSDETVRDAVLVTRSGWKLDATSGFHEGSGWSWVKATRRIAK